MFICTTIHQLLVFYARFLNCITVRHLSDEAYAKFRALSFLPFEIVSYFDIRISNLVAAKGRARFISAHSWLI